MEAKELFLCPVCGENKEAKDFHVNNFKPGNRAWMCKVCVRNYHKKRADNPKQRYRTARSKANFIGREFSLQFPEYLHLISGRCSYCEQEIESTGTGLDRLDNSRGYSADNVVACCWVCNRTRADYFTPDEMRDKIGPIIKEIKLGRITKNAVSGVGS